MIRKLKSEDIVTQNVLLTSAFIKPSALYGMYDDQFVLYYKKKKIAHTVQT